jgi:all-trans-retinol 13,14-reductase
MRLRAHSCSWPLSKSGAAIDGYLAKVGEVVAGMKRYYLARTAPARLAWLLDHTLARGAQRALELRTGEVVRGLTDDPRLQAMLVAQWGYYGSPPSRSSFAIQALVTHHFKWGGYYPVGGAQQIARALLATVAKQGGWTRISTDVAEILVEKGRAVGVRLDTGEEIRARRVISAAGIVSTVLRLLPPAYREEPWAKEVLSLAPAPAHVCLYLGFKGDIRAAGAGPANRWFYQTWDMEAEAWRIDAPDPLPDAPVLYSSFPSLKDPEHDPGPDQRHTGEVVTFVPWAAFERWQDERWKKRGESYEALKQRLHDALLEQFLDRMPGLRPHLDYSELSTPVSTHKFTRPIQGSIYGIEPTPARFRSRWLRPRSPVPGLFFSGSEVATVGVMGAMMGGVLAGLAINPVGALGYIRRHGMPGRGPG